MKVLAVVVPLALATSVFGQAVHRSFGSVVFPGGTSSTSSGITRNFGSVVFPGGMQTQPVYGGAPVIGARPGAGVITVTPAGNSNVRRTPTNGRGTRSTASYVYAVPVYIGGGYDNSYATQEPAPQPPNVTVIYPPQQQATPVMIQAGPDGEYTTMVQRQPATIYEAPRRRETVEEPEPAADSTRYLLAFKDHTIYSAVAYWADGDTLHYFTTGNVHNQASLSLIDRNLTDRLNRELGIDFKLPAAK
jgi:hypothetical protein